MEHEERINNQEELKNQLILKEQFNVERINYEREEMRDKYSNMDALVRAEFQRKDEAIRALQNIMETQLQSLKSGLKNEEMTRNQFETILRSEFLKFQENFRKVFIIINHLIFTLSLTT